MSVYVCLLMCMYMHIHTCKGVFQCVYKCVELRSPFLGVSLRMRSILSLSRETRFLEPTHLVV